MIGTREECENRVRTPFKKLATTSSNVNTNITKHNAVKEFNLGYSIVEIPQFLKMEKQTSGFDSDGTIFCWRAQDRWKEAR